MIEGAGGRHPAAQNRFELKNRAEPVQPQTVKQAPTDGPLNAPNTGPFGNYSLPVDPAQPSAGPEQITRLGELGITVTDTENLSTPDAQNAIDYLGSDNRLGTGFLVESWTAADLKEGIGLLEDMSAVGVELGSSSYVAGQWSLDEIREVHDVVGTMTDGAEERFLATHSDEELVRLAAWYGLPPEHAGDAAFVQAIDSIRRETAETDPEFRPLEIRRDAGSNVHYVLDSNGQVEWRDGKPATHDGVWYARADGRRLTLGDRAFFEGEQQAPTKNGFSFTSGSLIAHEIAHHVVGSYPGFGGQFDELADGVSDDDSRGRYVTQAGSAVELATNSSGYAVAPRSSDAGDEEAADLVTNGLLGRFTDDDAGRARAEQFAIMLDRVFADNMPAIPEGFELPPAYAAAASGSRVSLPGAPRGRAMLID